MCFECWKFAQSTRWQSILTIFMVLRDIILFGGEVVERISYRLCAPNTLLWWRILYHKFTFKLFLIWSLALEITQETNSRTLQLILLQEKAFWWSEYLSLLFLIFIPSTSKLNFVAQKRMVKNDLFSVSRQLSCQLNKQRHKSNVFLFNKTLHLVKRSSFGWEMAHFVLKLARCATLWSLGFLDKISEMRVTSA